MRDVWVVGVMSWLWVVIRCWMLVDGRRKRYQIQKKKSKYNLYHLLHTAY